MVSEQMLTRAQLESLTTNDLIRAADKFGIDIPPDLDRILIIEELLEITYFGAPHEFIDGDDTAEASLAALSEIEPVPLPKQYNITYIDVIIRDPFWAFVFWEVKSIDKEQIENAEGFEGYYLKVSPVDSSGALAEGTFTVPVSADDTGRYLGLNPAAKKTAASPMQRQTQYKVELCAGTKEGEAVLAVSNPFSMPPLHQLPAGRESRLFAQENPIAVLSGYEDFAIIRGSDRKPRQKRSALSGSL